MSVLVRSATVEDVLDVARVHVRAWQAAYRELLPDEYLDRLRPEDRARRYEFTGTDPEGPATIVAVHEDEITGFATMAPARDADSRGNGELCALYVDPKWWGRGFGSALMQQARYRLRELGFRAALLWVMVGNSRAEHFYGRDGWTADGMRRTADVWGVTVEELRYRRLL